MQNVYDKIKDFAMILADHDTAMAERFRGLMRGVVITGTDANNKPIFSKIPYILRSMVYVDPDTNVSDHGTFSMALPVIVEKDGNILFLRVLQQAETPDPKLLRIEDWELPEGGQDGVASGQGGVLVVGTEIDENKKIFIPGGKFQIVSDHRGSDPTTGSTIVSDLTVDDEIGLQALLAKAFWVVNTPTRVDAKTRNVIALNSYSAGARSGRHVEHQGGAIVLYNSNIRSAVGGDTPKVVSWSAWTDDGPYFEGEGARDAHLKGIDAEGVPHLPLMYRKERTKFGPGPLRTPSAPFDFLEQFAVTPRFSTRIFRAEIVYDKKLFHPNPSGIVDPVIGRWVVEYRLPHQPPFDETQVKDTEDTQKKDTNVKTPHEPQRKSESQEKEETQQKDPRDPITPEPNPRNPGPITGDPPAKPGPNDSGGGPGTCGIPGEPPVAPGPGENPDGPGKEAGPADQPTGPITQDSQEKKQAALKKAKEAANARANGIDEVTNFPEDQTNTLGGDSIDTLLQELELHGQSQQQRKPLHSHMQVGYPSFVAIVPNPEDLGLTQRGDLTPDEIARVDKWNFGSTQIAAFGNIIKPAVKVRIDNDRNTVLGGFVIAGSDLQDIYEGAVSNLTAVLALRPEAEIAFGEPIRGGGIESPVRFLDDRVAGEFCIVRRNDVSGDVADLDYPIHFKSPLRLTNVITVEREAMLPANGVLAFDSDEGEVFVGQDAAFTRISGDAHIQERFHTKTDFVNAVIGASPVFGDLRAIAASGGFVSSASGVTKLNAPGIIGLNTGATSAAGRVFLLSNTISGFLMGIEQPFRCYNFIKTPAILGTVAESYVVRAGVSSVGLPNSLITAITFEYQHDENGGRWQGVINDVGETSVDLGITIVVSTAYKLVFVVNAAGTSVDFFIDGILRGTAAVAADIPGGGGFNHFYNTHIMKLNGIANRALYVDAMEIDSKVRR